MTLALFVEGETEGQALPSFFKRWLDPRLPQPVRVQSVELGGWGKFNREIVQRVTTVFQQPRAHVVGAVGLLDLYGPPLPLQLGSVEERRRSAIASIEQQVRHPRFTMHFAVHETEAWLLSQPGIFPVDVRAAIERHASRPEAVNGSEPPSVVLNAIYRRALDRKYRKVVDGTELFKRLDPERARTCCPALDGLLQSMLTLARA